MTNMARTTNAMLTFLLVMAGTEGIGAQSMALSRAAIQEAIDFGLGGDPQPYFCVAFQEIRTEAQTAVFPCLIALPVNGAEGKCQSSLEMSPVFTR